uniref:Gingipain domain-containing protein n=1 Tax=candidate division WOR-3 bacterium TaxID=2052148 RepID=A0A7V6CN22_UNCW3
MKRFFFFLFLTILFAQEGARYLIITYDNFFPAIKELANWKTKKGVLAKVVKLSEIGGNNANLIKNYILNAYNNWPIRPEYVLFVGYPNLLTSYYDPTYRIYTDNWYCDVNNDNKADIPYGRFPARNIRECSLMVKKTIAYEKYLTFSIDTLWIRKGCGIVNEGGDADDTIYWNDVRLFAQYWAPSLYFYDSLSRLRGNNANDVINRVNEGRNFVIYRGSGVGNWYTPFNVNPNLTNNGLKLPIVLSMTCQTMSLNSALSETTYVGQRWLWVGTYDAPKGAVAFFGNTHSDVNVARVRSCCLRAFIKELFIKKNNILGKCCLKAKDTMYLWNFADGVGYNLFGDPELNIYTETPKILNVSHPTYIPRQPQSFLVRVLKEGEPQESAFVCIKKGDSLPFEIYQYGYTNNQGEITFSISPATTGIIEVTVTYKNSLPYEGICEVIPGSGPYLTFDTLQIFDFPPLGNGDNKINPGETILMRVGIKNIGEESANNVFGVLRTNSSEVLIFDSLSSYGNIPPQETRFNETNFRLYVSPTCQASFLSFVLVLTDGNNNNWQVSFNSLVYKGKISFLSYLIKDTFPLGNNNQRLDPGEGAIFIITLKNEGNADLRKVYCKLKSEDTLLKVSDSLGSFGEILTNQVKNNNSDPLGFYLSPMVFAGRDFRLKIYVFGSNHTYEISDSFAITLTCGEGNANLPTGPDFYGYYLYDNTDVSSGNAPTYNWIDIRSIGSQIPGVSEANDTTVTIPLPFRFKFYGNFYDSISVSSNGFLSMGRTNYRSPDNLYLPNAEIPTNIISPFWDDLSTVRRMQIDPVIYQYYDANNHLFIIEFYNLYHPNAYNQREIFEVIFYHPDYYPTPTGDGEIVFQYNTVSNALSNTVGIQDNNGETGLTYLFNGNYHPTASQIVSGRAIKITTNPPRLPSLPFITLENLSFSDSLGNNNGIIEIGEPILLKIALKNSGTQTANNLVAILEKRDNDCFINDSLFDIGNLAVGEIRNNYSHPYLFVVSNTPADTVLEFLLKIQGDNYQSGIYFNLGVARFQTVLENKNNPIKIWPTILRKEMMEKILTGEVGLFDCLGRKVKLAMLKKGIYFVKEKDKKKMLIVK